MTEARSDVKIVSPKAFDILRKYDSATVANVIELFQYRSSTAGYLRGHIRAIYPDLPPVVGYATTVFFWSLAALSHTLVTTVDGFMLARHIQQTPLLAGTVE